LFLVLGSWLFVAQRSCRLHETLGFEAFARYSRFARIGEKNLENNLAKTLAIL
jgi:hypothetical protein